MISRPELDPRRLWRDFVLRVGVLLAVAGSFFFAYNFYTDGGQIDEAALKRARAHFRDTLTTLRWASEQGGVYIETRPDDGANPYPQYPDVQTQTGTTLRLHHPDRVLFEVAEMARREDDLRFHLVGMQTRNPLNAPDTWESLALDTILGGRVEFFEHVEVDGRTLFRYMAQVRTETHCLRCHVQEGFKAGDVQGGIAISFDISELVTSNRLHQITSAFVILLTLVLTLWATNWFSQRLDRQLSRISRRYEDMLQSTESIVWEAEPETLQLTFVSDQVRRLLGYTPDECISQVFWFRCIHPEDVLRVWETYKAHRETDKPLRLDYRMIDRQGKEIWMQDVVVFAEQEGGKVLRGVLLDISERKNAERRVQEMYAEQSAILQNALVGIAVIRDRELISCNNRFEEIFGAPAFSMVGMTTRSLYPSEGVYLEVGQRVKEAFERGESFKDELLLSRQDGSLFWAAIAGQMLNPGRPDQGAIWIYTDISERKAAQAALKEHQARLEQLIEQRTADLRQALDDARAADRAKDEFLANISHEMRTPLNAVIGLAGIARKHSGDARVQDYLDKISGGGQSLLRIINDLLDLSKIAAGRMELEAIPLRLGQIVNHLRSMVQHRIEEKQLQFTVEVDPALPAVCVGDPLRVEQIVLNLVTNAIKFTEQGGVTVRFNHAPAPAGKVGLQLEIEDTGIGMTPDEMKNLFQPFSQADSSITRTHGGTGLGLVICRRLAEMMGGDIEVSSVRGKGSLFSVRMVFDVADNLSVSGEEERQEADALSAENVRYRNTRLLVVDDQPINRQIANELLKEVGITCDEAENGRIAVDMILSQPPDTYAMVFMDMQMPEMDGYSATRALRTHATLAKLPIIALTAFAMEHERQACLAAGMNDHLGKPFDTEKFYQLLRRWIPADRQYSAEPAAPLAAAPPAAAESVSIPGLDMEGGLKRFAGNRASYLKWLGSFAGEGSAPLDAVAGELAAGNREQALKTLHAFKGRCGMLGMTLLWQAVVDLEAAMKQDAPHETLFAAARQRQDEVLEALRGVINENNG